MEEGKKTWEKGCKTSKTRENHWGRDKSRSSVTPKKGRKTKGKREVKHNFTNRVHYARTRKGKHERKRGGTKQ